MPLPINCCRLCGATSYRRVIERDGAGGLRASGMYQCSGCSVVFADPKAWREAGPEGSPAAPRIRPLVSTDANAAKPTGGPSRLGNAPYGSQCADPSAAEAGAS